MIAENLYRMLSWFVRKAGAGTILTFTLLMVTVEALVWALEASIRGLENSWLPFAALFGLLSGWWFARTKLNSLQAGLAGISLGAVVSLIYLGRLTSPIFSVIFSLPLVEGSFIRWEGLPDLARILPPLVELWASASIPLARMAHWAAGIISGGATYDPAATVLFWSQVVWMLAIWGSWFVRRRSKPLPAVLPSGALLVVILNYTRGSVLPLAALLAGTLLLLSLVEFQDRVQNWEKSGIDYSEDVRFEMALASVSLVLVLSIAAVLTPSISIRQLVDWTRSMRAQGTGESGQVAESFGLKPRPFRKSPFGDYYSPGLPRKHLLGSGPELSEQVVMAVEVQGLPVPTGPIPQPPAQNFYWRGIVYDRYTGRGWVTGSTEITPYPAGETIATPEYPTLKHIQQKVHLYTLPGTDDMQLLYAAGEMASVDQEIQVARRSHQDVFGILGETREYQAVSLVSSADENELRNSTQDYPQWVRVRYLALPDSVPARVLGLGRDLTATGATPYDRALAIESYLRTIPYSLDVSVPAGNRDVSDYFLFDLRRGYCDYYATAMVVLARAAGLPARLVTGFAPGRYDPGNATFIVTAADAHSWVEIFFPGFGWIEFEPTAGRSPVQRSSGILPQTTDPELQLPETLPSGQVEVPWMQVFALISGLAVLSLCGYAGWLYFDSWSLKRLSPSGTIAALYRRLYRDGCSLDDKITPAFTPHEFARHLVQQIERIGQGRRFQRRLAPASEEVDQLATLFARTSYSLRIPGYEEQKLAIRLWKRLHRRLWLARLVTKGRT